MFEMSWDKLQSNLPQGTLQEKKKFGPDERFFKLSRGDDDKGSAIIRLLPDKNGIPFVKMFSHSIKKYDPGLGKDRYYIEDSPQSIGLPCPAAEKWQELMKIGTEQSKEEARLYSRKLKFITNILVVKDPFNPANNGKVMLWEFGTKLNDKFISAMNPSDEDIELGTKAKELYHPLKGCNILLKIKKSSGFFNYDDTSIMDATSVSDTEEEAIELINKTYELNEFLSPEHYGTYDELKIKLDKTINGSKSKYISGASTSPEGNIPPQEAKPSNEKLIPEKEVVEATEPPKPKAKASEDADIDDILNDLDNL